MIEECRGIIKNIDDDFIMIVSNDKEYFAIPLDFLYDDYLIGDEVIFKPVNWVVPRATLISQK